MYTLRIQLVMVLAYCAQLLPCRLMCVAHLWCGGPYCQLILYILVILSTASASGHLNQWAGASNPACPSTNYRTQYKSHITVCS
jgi:hypothetical protein